MGEGLRHRLHAGRLSTVVCVGLATRDTILAVPRHPAADELVLATDATVAGGGPAATAAVALVRLGVPTAFVGAVGDDDAGTFVRDGLEAEGVDVSELAVVGGRRSPESAIYAGPGTRAIAAFLGDTGPPVLSPRAERLCRDAAWVHVDQTGYGAVPRDDVHLSIDAGIPIDGLDVAGVAVYGPTEAALERDFGSAETALAAGAALVVVTRGERGCTAYTAESAIEAEGDPIENPVSTLGAGDVFHGALLAAFVHGRELAEALAFANRAAALSCRALDGRSAIPTLKEMITT